MSEKKTFRIEVLPAGHGDALLIEYGGEDTRRILIDGGPISTYENLDARLAQLPEKGIELLVITHVDTDHIEGIIRLLAAPPSDWSVKPREIWFNSWRHLHEDHLGGREGEFMGAVLEVRAKSIWNRSFDGNAVRVEADSLPRFELKGGMVLTLLSPDAQKLEKLIKDWEKSAKDWKLTPGDVDKALKQLAGVKKFGADPGLTLGPDDLAPELLAQIKKRDGSDANGSSIAFLAEFEGKRCLFLADAHMDVICASLRKLGHTPDEPLVVDAVKMSHHGSSKNISKEFLELVDAEHYLVSTNGDVHGHPDKPAMDTVIVGSRREPTIWFNYRSDTTLGWEERSKEPGARFRVAYPDDGSEGIAITL